MEIIGSIAAPIPYASTSINRVDNTQPRNIEVDRIDFSPTIDVKINHTGAMTDSDAQKFGKTIASTAANELYEGFRQRGIGKIFGTRPTK